MALNAETLRERLESARAFEQAMAANAYAGSQKLLVEAGQVATSDLDAYWARRNLALARQAEGDLHAYAENVLSRLLHTQSVLTYHDDHTDDESFGADGRDAHAS